MENLFTMKRIILISLSLLLFVFLGACSQQSKEQQNLSSLFPKSIDKWHLVEMVTGSTALEKINSLHGKDITVEAGAIGTYQVTGKKPAMIWVSRSKTSDLTREQAEVMADKMETNSHLPFHAPETFIRNKIKVYKFLGMGQVHYIFCKGPLGFWISAPPEDGERLLRYFLKNREQEA
jgi:hypothetical protein